MTLARRGLSAIGAAALALGFSGLGGCNSRLPMAGATPRLDQTFLGPIPLTFRNTVDRPTFEAAAFAASAHYAGAASAVALALAPGGGLPLAPTATTPSDGLMELAGCNNLKALMGSFLTEADLTAEAQPAAQTLLDPASLAGKSCTAALAEAGVGFADVVAALQVQASNLAKLTLSPDTCTAVTDAAGLSPRAAVRFDLPRETGSGAALTDQIWPTFTAELEGGADGSQLALRGETEADAKQATDAGERELYHWTAIASLADTAALTTVSQKGEQLSVSETATGAVAHETHLDRLVSVTLAYGKTPGVDEVTERAYYVDGALVRNWTVTMHASPAGGGGLAVDLTVAAQGAPTTAKSAKLLLKQAAGGCEARLR